MPAASRTLSPSPQKVLLASWCEKQHLPSACFKILRAAVSEQNKTKTKTPLQLCIRNRSKSTQPEIERLWFPPQLKSIFLRVTIASAHTQANATWEPEDKKMQPQKSRCLLSAHMQAGGPAATLLLLPGVVYANQETLQKADRKWALKSLLGTMPANVETYGHSELLQIDGKYVCERTMHGFLNKFWDTQVKLAVIPPFSNFLKCPPSH